MKIIVLTTYVTRPDGGENVAHPPGSTVEVDDAPAARLIAAGAAVPAVDAAAAAPEPPVLSAWPSPASRKARRAGRAGQ
ncbi:MAG: hypothetical protein HY057_08995 [Rhodospirillales bacterium]|nr:hypothetical protein [Rhodospirillales bacterium]